MNPVIKWTAKNLRIYPNKHGGRGNSCEPFFNFLIFVLSIYFICFIQLLYSLNDFLYLAIT